MNRQALSGVRRRDLLHILPDPGRGAWITLVLILLCQAGAANTGLSDSYEYWFHAGMQFHQEGRLSEAKEAYEQGLVRDPNNAALLNNLGNVLSDLGDHQEALTRYEQARKLRRYHNPW